MEVVQHADVVRGELEVEDGVVVEAADRILVADLGEDLWLKACSRASTAWRSSSLFDGETIDWQMCANDQMKRAVAFVWNSCHSR